MSFVTCKAVPAKAKKKNVWQIALPLEVRNIQRLGKKQDMEQTLMNAALFAFIQI